MTSFSFGAELLSEEAEPILGLSEETACYVSVEYFTGSGRFDDFVVHEAAHVFHNCKRQTVGLPHTRRREWLLEIEFAKRETFACACEVYARILEQDALAELEREPLPGVAGMNPDEYVDVLQEAVAARNGWKRILARCAPSRHTRQRRATELPR